jgi:tetratricopeptide (TPR) repeat protein
MLNYILPPIIIVIAVSMLIMFLFRKAAQIPAGEFIADEYKRESERSTTKIMAVIGQMILKFLERLMHHSKLLSLKFHNVSNVWFQTIREKRQRGVQLQKEAQERSAQQQVTANIATRSSEVDVLPDRQEPRPMVRTTVTMPQRTNVREKNQLEDALIKRIAINPRDIEAYERLGDYYLENSNFQDSLECFKQVLHLSPAHHKARLRVRRLEKMK